MDVIFDNEHIRSFVITGDLDVITSDISQLAYQYLINQFPFQSMATTSILDWTRIHCSSMNWANSTDDEVELWARDTLAGKCSLGLLLYSESSKSVLGSFGFIIRNLDTLIWKSPGCNLLLGVEKSKSGTLVFTDGIIETDGKGRLFASIPEPG